MRGEVPSIIELTNLLAKDMFRDISIHDGGNPEAGNYFRTRNSAHKKTNRLHLSRKAKIRRRKSA